MDNIDILTEYINSHENPREFMELLFSFLKPRVKNCSDTKDDSEIVI